MLTNKFKPTLLSLSICAMTSFFILPTLACTRILDANNGQAVLVGRTMDWSTDLPANLLVYPQGIKRDGLASVNSMQWTAQYGSLVAAVFGATLDGINEKGLAVHILWLDEANYGKRDVTLPGMSLATWGQFYLDNFPSVDEAVRYTETNQFQLEPMTMPGSQNSINVHLAIEDAQGDSAIIEYVDGKRHIYHHRQYTVLTNSPTFNLQLNNLKQYQGFGGEKLLPGTTDSKDRFVRATYYSSRLPATQTTQEAITNLMSVVQNIAEPFEKSTDEHDEIEPTFWRTLADLTHHSYYYQHTTSLNFIWTQLDKFNLQPGAPIMKLDLEHNQNLSGDVTDQFKAEEK